MSNEVVKSTQTIQQFNFLNPDHFSVMQRVCTMFATSELVPKMYRISAENPKEKAIANCMIAIETASRIGASPLMVMQNMYIVHGQPAWSAKFLTATVNGCGRYNSIKYKMDKLGTTPNGKESVENWQCIAYTSEKGSDEILESVPVTIEMAIAEGWYNKNGSKWKTIPKLMLQYRAVTFWTRAYAPELSMGIRPEDEVEDIIPYEDVTEKIKQEVASNANKSEISIETPANTETKPEAEPVNGQAELSGPGF